MVITLVPSHKSQLMEAGRTWQGCGCCCILCSGVTLLLSPPPTLLSYVGRLPTHLAVLAGRRQTGLDCRRGKGGQLNSPAVQTGGPNININPHQDRQFPH